MKYRILVVEDNALNREMLCDWLEIEDYEAVPTTDIRTAWEALQGQPPHLVLLDVQLGNEDGLALAVRMRKEPSLCQVPVIVVTAHAMVTEKERIFRAGCNAYISKPIDFKLLQENLQRWLPGPVRVPPDP